MQESGKKVHTSLRLTLAVYMMLEPSLLKCGCPLSLSTNTISAGMFSGVSSPSLGKVILVPSFQPLLMTILRILSSVRVVLPSGLRRRRVMRMRLVHPWKISSRDTRRSCTTGGSCTFLLVLLLLCKGSLRGLRPAPRWNPLRPLKPKWLKELNGSSSPSMSMSMSWFSAPLLLFQWRPEPKKISNGLEPPKNDANVACGSTWKV